MADNQARLAQIDLEKGRIATSIAQFQRMITEGNLLPATMDQFERNIKTLEDALQALENERLSLISPQGGEQNTDSSGNREEPARVIFDPDPGGELSNQVEFSSAIVPRRNPLSQFSSYSYVVSIYILTNEQYNQINGGEKITIPDSQLILQSGGAPVGKRHPRFYHDFFIDDIEIKTIVTPAETQAPINSLQYKFTVTEPYSITFIDRLKLAHQDLGNSGPFLLENYLMLIRFYGYDKDGHKILSTQPMSLNDPTAISEKYYTFIMSDVRFRIANGVTKYFVSGIPLWTRQGISQGTSSIPTSFAVTGITVQDILGASAQNASVPSLSASTSALNSTSDSFVDAVNKQFDEAGNPDRIAIEILDPEIAQAIVRPDVWAHRQSMPNVQVQDPGRTDDSSKVNTSLQERVFNFSRGTPIIDAINNLIENSEFIRSQATVAVNETTGEVTPRPVTDDTTWWYQVNVRTVRASNEFDKKLNRYPQLTTYMISRYRVILEAPNFKKTRFYGPQKRYFYSFTGQNTEVLDYEQVFNSAYIAEGASDNLTNASQNLLTPGNLQDVQIRRIGDPLPGAITDVNTPTSYARSYLYNIADLGAVKMKILGDPDWLGEDDIKKTGIHGRPFDDTGAINYNHGLVFFQVSFNLPGDYNLETGKMAVETVENDHEASRINYFYNASIIDSSFKSGFFSQQLSGFLRFFTPEELNVYYEGSNTDDETLTGAEVIIDSQQPRSND